MEFHLIVISCNNQSGFDAEILKKMANLGITPHFIHCGENGIENMQEIRLQGRIRAAIASKYRFPHVQSYKIYTCTSVQFFTGGHAESRNQRSIFYAVQRLSDKLHDEKDVAVQVGSKCGLQNFKT